MILSSTVDDCLIGLREWLKRRSPQLSVRILSRSGPFALILLLFSSALQFSVEMRQGFADVGRPVIFEGMDHITTFLNVLDQRGAGRGSVRITHIGDSHIIADFWTGEMRERLQKRFGDGGRGFVLGGEMWRSFSQRHIRHVSRGEWEVTHLKRGRDMGVFGPGGAALICSRVDCVTSIMTTPGQRSALFDQVEVYTLGHGQGGRFRVRINQEEVGVVNTFSPWLTVQRHIFSSEIGSTDVSVETLDDLKEVWVFGFSLKDSRGGLIYDSIGLNGAQAQHLLKNTDQALIQSLDYLQSNLFVISFGINEVFDRNYETARYRAHLDQTLKSLRKERGRARTDCLLTGPFAALRGGVPLRKLDEVYQVQRELSEKYGCAFWDARTAMGGDLRAWQRKNFARRDGVHLSRRGYNRIAELFEESLLLTLVRWRALTPHHPDAVLKRSP